MRIRQLAPTVGAVALLACGFVLGTLSASKASPSVPPPDGMPVAFPGSSQSGGGHSSPLADRGADNSVHGEPEVTAGPQPVPTIQLPSSSGANQSATIVRVLPGHLQWDYALKSIEKSNLPPRRKEAARREFEIRKRLGEIVPARGFELTGLLGPSYIGRLTGLTVPKRVNAFDWVGFLCERQRTLPGPESSALEEELWRFQEQEMETEKALLRLALDVAMIKIGNGETERGVAFFVIDGQLVVVREGDSPQLSGLLEERHSVDQQRKECVERFLLESSRGSK